jgi:hypothetical protein
MNKDHGIVPPKAETEAVEHTSFMLGCKNRLEAMLADPFVGNVGNAFPFRRRVECRDSRLTKLCRVLSSSGLPLAEGTPTTRWPLTPDQHLAGNPLIIEGKKYSCGQPILREVFERMAPAQQSLVILPGSQFFWAGDPLWSTLFAPPSYFGCRCSATAYDIAGAAKNGVIAAQRWLETGIRPHDHELCVPRPRVRLSKKWTAYRDSMRNQQPKAP